jgi:hypothetical protein
VESVIDASSPPSLASLTLSLPSLLEENQGDGDDGGDDVNNQRDLDDVLSQDSDVSSIDGQSSRVSSPGHSAVFGDDMMKLLPPSLLQLKNLKFLDLSNNLLTGPLPGGTPQHDSSSPSPTKRDSSRKSSKPFLSPPSSPGGTGDSGGGGGGVAQPMSPFLAPSAFDSHNWACAHVLQELCLQHNRLTGNIPDCMSEFVNLNVLRLEGNQLGGELSTELLKCWSQLNVLKLSGNRLTGEIPDQIGLFCPLLEVIVD